jgi:hypothetical protein
MEHGLRTHCAATFPAPIFKSVRTTSACAVPHIQRSPAGQEQGRTHARACTPPARAPSRSRGPRRRRSCRRGLRRWPRTRGRRVACRGRSLGTRRRRRGTRGLLHLKRVELYALNCSFAVARGTVSYLAVIETIWWSSEGQRYARTRRAVRYSASRSISFRSTNAQTCFVLLNFRIAQ